jgi:spore maturation protein SpmA/spore maturation protein SpmB
MNVLFLILIMGATAASALAELSGHSGSLTALTEATLRSAQDAIQLALSLAASLAVFMGILRIAEQSGLLPLLARPLMPLLACLFPHDPDCRDAIALNVSANLLGMGNAATPFGLKAMALLETSNPHKGIASNAQIMFLALNTAGITLLPAKVIALRASLGSADPASIVGPTLAASLCAATAGIGAAWLLGALSRPPREDIAGGATPKGFWLLTLLTPLLFIALLALVMISMGAMIGPWLLPLMIVAILAWGYGKKVDLYDGFVAGAKDGLLIAWTICPYLIAILVAVGMAGTSGALELVMAPLGHLLSPWGLPPQALIMAILRTLSGSGSFGLLASTLSQTETGPDTYLGMLLSTLYGSTETTFYVIAIYFGSVGTHKLRHAIAVGLIADMAGLIAATVICSYLKG